VEPLEERALLALTLSEWKTEDGGNGHFYTQVISDMAVDWATAKGSAEALEFLGVNGHLVTITSQGEQEFVTSLYDGERSWIGLTDDPAFGGTESFGQPNPQVDGWVWVTGELVSFTHWYNANEPNDQDNSGRAENFAMMDNGAIPGGWNDVPSGVAQWLFPRYIVEFDVPVSHNNVEPRDVNNNSSIDPNDLLIIFNYLNAKGPGPLSAGHPQGPPFLDVNGDRHVSPIDALMVINALNINSMNIQGAIAEGRGEALQGSMVSELNAPDQLGLEDALEALAIDCTQLAQRRRSAAWIL
jgi:hypothetical protein